VANETDLAARLLTKIESLTAGQEVDLCTRFEDFPELRAAFTIPHAELHLMPGRCVASLEDGGSIELVGLLKTSLDDGTEPALQFHRLLKLGERCAEHRWLKVAPALRGIGLSSALLLRSFEFYRALGISSVELDAAMETGKWHWARVGFEFMWPDQAAEVKQWALAVAEALGIEGANVEALSTATQFARMEGRRGVSLEEIARAFPDRAKVLDFREIADENGFDVKERVAFGRAVMLTGPRWEGRLDLKGPSYQQFKSYAEAKAEEAEKALGAG
jgi:GNAT superfamily N-acetyltransferase